MARRFGLEEISQEHTELCFRYLYPKRYERTLAHLQRLREQQAPSIQAMHRQIEEILQRCGLENTRIEEIWTHPASYIHSSEEAETVLEGYR
ncbi:MAG TPA: bifunctional (p)ppGpp synthetase/guanosine-3',5'-bis(diphosphate) 3'-pyrophosphohydrolase, partial [Deltaproteobacteria bacterium]|nr:bifunctional (p)ppGpp synthetase/guanosine-3',5'-bis(diphosphate) 3'-pyrophosphohydrolase [Deltaproteobacteria bacterium]